MDRRSKTGAAARVGGRVPRWRGLRPLLVLPMVVALSGIVAPAAVGASTSLPHLVSIFERAASSGSDAARREAALKVLADYHAYQDLVANKQVPPAVARALDEELVGMCRETWAEVGARMGTRLDHVVPVGTLGHRLTNPNYLPGKSDKDFIPRGQGAQQAVGEFENAFRERYGIEPASVQVNVLDPTKPQTWPERYAAATNPEKYNTIGGNRFLAAEEALARPDLWRFDPLTGQMRAYAYESIVRTPPATIGKADALGWFSDNTRFRGQLADEVLDPYRLALKQSKYDLRNLEAFRLAGGHLSAEDARLLEATNLLRGGKPDAAAVRLMDILGVADPDAAMAAYLRRMNELTAEMGRTVAQSHLAQMARSGLSAEARAALADELAASLANLPKAERDAAVEAMTKALGRREADAILSTANTFEKRVARGLTYFDDQAIQSFGRPYSQLTAEERAVLHGADGVAESFKSKLFTVAGVLLSGYAIYEAYKDGAKLGTGAAIGSALTRAMIEAIQAGMPVTAAVELVVRAAAGLVDLGANAWKDVKLEQLYQLYRAGQRDMFEVEAVASLGTAAGLRQYAISLGLPPGLSDAEIKARLLETFAKRQAAEEQMAKVHDQMNAAMQFMAMRGILPNNVLSVETLDPDQLQLLTGFMEAYLRIRSQLEQDGISGGVTDEMIFGVLWHLFNRAGTAASYQAAMRELYSTFRLTYPPRTVAKPDCKDRPRVTSATDARVRRAAPVRAPATTLLSGAGAFSQRIDGPCDPAVPLGPVEATCGGTVTATIDGAAVPCTWATYNHGITAWVGWTPTFGRADGPTTEVISASLACEGNPGAEHLVVTGTIPGPGRLSGWIGAPMGAGPLTSECFGAGGSVTVSMTEPAPDAAASPSDALGPGDRLVTGDTGSATLLVPGAATVRLRGGTDAGITGNAPADLSKATCGSSVTGVDLATGGMRLRTLPGGRDLPVRAGGRTVTPKGTDLVVEAMPDGGGRVTVVEGSAVVPGPDGAAVTVEAGWRYTWRGPVADGSAPDDASPAAPSMSDDLLEPVGDPSKGLAGNPAVDSLPMPAFLLDDTATVAGTVETVSTGIGDGVDGPLLPEGWTLVDAGADTVLEPAPDGTGWSLTVPDGNDLWGSVATAPMLLRRVTGDTLLEASIRLDDGPGDITSVEPVLVSTGSSVGATAGQMTAGTPAADALILVGGWVRYLGQDRLTGLACADGDIVECPEAPTPAVPVGVRIERDGDILRAFRRVEGGGWVLAFERTIPLPDTLFLGFVVKRIASDGRTDLPARASIADVRVVTGLDAGTLRPSGWMARSESGVTPLGDGSVALTVDDLRTGTAVAAGAQPLEGDLDVVARFDMAPLSVAGGSRTAALQLIDESGRNAAYVAFRETPGRRVATADVRVDAVWRAYTELRTTGPDPTRFRLSRRDGMVTASVYADCRWHEVATFALPLTETVSVQVLVDNAWEAWVPSRVVGVARLERVADGPHLDDSPLVDPPCSSAAVEVVPPALVASLPDGTTARVSRLGVPAGRVAFHPAGALLALGLEKDRGALYLVNLDGTALLTMESPSLAGLNRKTLAWRDGRMLLAVDYWPEGGSSVSGIVEVAPDGTATAWPPDAELMGADGPEVGAMGGMTDLAVLPDGHVLTADFEADSISRLPADTRDQARVITDGTVLAGMLAIAPDPDTGEIAVLDVDGEWPLGGPAGVAIVAPDGTVGPVVPPPDGSAGLAALARSDGRVLPAGLYVAEPSSGRVLRLDGDTWVAVLAGLPGVSDLAFDPVTGDLAAVFDGSAVVRVSGVRGAG